jgi:hypothetical protein
MDWKVVVRGKGPKTEAPCSDLQGANKIESYGIVKKGL